MGKTANTFSPEAHKRAVRPVLGNGNRRTSRAHADMMAVPAPAGFAPVLPLAPP